MKRDMDLVRRILFEVEKLPPLTARRIEVEGYSMNEVAYHCEMLYRYGLIKRYHGDEIDQLDGVIDFWVEDLTWQGHDFLEKIREDTVWNKTKRVMKDKGLPFVLETVNIIASSFITAAAEGVANSIIKNGGQI